MFIIVSLWGRYEDLVNLARLAVTPFSVFVLSYAAHLLAVALYLMDWCKGSIALIEQNFPERLMNNINKQHLVIIHYVISMCVMGHKDFVSCQCVVLCRNLFLCPDWSNFSPAARNLCQLPSQLHQWCHWLRCKWCLQNTHKLWLQHW